MNNEELKHAHQQLGTLEQQPREMQRKIEELTLLTATDELTGLRNSRRFKEDLESACAYANRQNLLVSAIVLDLDDFKSYNDTFGKSDGDQVLSIAARILTARVRSYDIVARVDGAEIFIILPSTDRFEARRVADRLRKALESCAWPQRPITATFGVATLESRAVSPSQLVDQARLAMHHAKGHGKNRVTHFVDLDCCSLSSAEASMKLWGRSESCIPV
jgi:diguanylate cyclase (GGDEF)-like protein